MWVVFAMPGNLRAGSAPGKGCEPPGRVLGKAMIAKIKAMILGGGAVPAAAADRADDVEAAAVALLVETAVLDGDFGDDERRAIAGLLESRFGIPGGEARELIALGEERVRHSSQLFEFTRVINKGFDQGERVQMIEMLWEVAYADGVLHDLEASLVRRVTGLLHVPDRLAGAARKRVRNRLAPDHGGA
jgi:uncharacterized tellurite resistance protein B-like protein